MPLATLEKLAKADAFHALGLNRRQALWAIRGLGEKPLPLLDAMERREEPVSLVPLTAGREVVEDYRATQLTLRQHPLFFLRDALSDAGVIPCLGLRDVRDGKRVEVAGIILVRQKPGSAKGVLFITVEDETGVANIILWPDRFEAQRTVVIVVGDDQRHRDRPARGPRNRGGDPRHRRPHPRSHGHAAGSRRHRPARA